MATSKITITLRDDQLKEIRYLVAAQQTSSVSAFVQHAVGVAVSDAAGWQEILLGALQETGGALTKKGTGMGRRTALRRSAKQTRQEAEGGVSGITLDAGGLIALDRNKRRVIALIARSLELGLRVTIPATALAQAIRNPARQARPAAFTSKMTRL